MRLDAARELRRGRARLAVALAASLLVAPLLVTPLVATAPAAAATASGTSWSVLASRPGAVAMAAISCPTAEVCTAVGGAAGESVALGTATILRTTDGGATWTREAAPSGDGSLLAVSCPTVSYCLAMGDGYYAPYLTSTSDGGATWTVAPGPPGLYDAWLDTLDCLSARDCYAEGVDSGAVLFHTADGGTSWTQAPLDTGTNAFSSSTPASLSCPTASTCVVARGVAGSSRFVLLRSADAGASATVLRHVAGSAEAPPSVTCFTALACLVSGAGEGARVLVTTDGGARWASRALPPGVLGIAARCHDATHCLVVGASSDGLVAASTSDLGATWTVHDVVSGVPRTLLGDEVGLACPTATRCALERPGAPGLATTADGGATWATAPWPPGRTSLDAVACPDVRHCVAVGAGSAMWAIDASRHWYAAATPPPLDVDLMAVACPTAALCVAGGLSFVGDGLVGELYRSTDEGRDWAQVALPHDVAQVTSVACASTTTCVAGVQDVVDGNADPGILRSVDGGASWQPVALPTAPEALSVNGISCGSPTRCLAVGASVDGATSLSTTDGGATWTVEVGPSGVGDLADVDCTSATDCVVTGLGEPAAPLDAAFVATSTADLGTTWSAPATFGEGSLPWSLACAGSTCESVAEDYNYDGAPTTVLDTSRDDGVSWSASSLPAGALDVFGVGASPSLGFVAAGASPQNGPIVLSGR